MKDNLNGNIPYTLQPPKKLDHLRGEVRYSHFQQDLSNKSMNRQMANKYPIVRLYEDNWATNDFLKAALKYYQTQAKQEEDKLQAVQQALQSLEKEKKSMAFRRASSE